MGSNVLGDAIKAALDALSEADKRDRTKAMRAMGNAIEDWSVSPSRYERSEKWFLKPPYTTVANRYTLVSPAKLSVNIDVNIYFFSTQQELVLSNSSVWDDLTTDWTVAANRAGKDFYIYACEPASGNAPVIILSNNSTIPVGHNADNSRKIGGFHCLCVAVGTIAGHVLTGFVVGDILPASIWDLNHRPECDPAGMVYSEKTGYWYDIYLQSGTGSATASAYNATIADTRVWMDHVDDLGAVGKELLEDYDFQLVAAGSNEETNIVGSSDPVTTGGHSDTAARRMISNIGLEDCCGAMWQWLKDQSYRADGTTWAWYDLPGAKGSLYRQGTYGDIKLLAGGGWTYGVYCGSRGRHANNYRWAASTHIGGRGRCGRRK